MSKVETVKKSSVRAAEKSPVSILLNNVTLSELNPRCTSVVQVESLSADINKQGLLQPITLRRKKSGGYEVVIGTLRFRAIQAARVPEGVLNAGEFVIVDWDDDRCIQAAISENTERTDLSLRDQGQYLKNLGRLLAEKGNVVTDELLEQKTGIDRPRINDLRYMVDRFDVFPPSWQDQFSVSPSCRSNDNMLDPDSIITLTHLKHVRSLITDTIAPKVLKLMDKAVQERLSCAKFKDAVEALKSEEGITKAPKAVRGRDPEAVPNYTGVIKGLKAAVVQIGKDDETATLLDALIIRIEELLKKQKEAEAANADKPEEKAA